MSPTAYWVQLGRERVHMACLNESEVMLSLMFCNPDAPGSEKPCARCGVALNQVPDP